MRRRAALYLRVSPEGQTTDNQWIALEEVGTRRAGRSWTSTRTPASAAPSGAKQAPWQGRGSPQFRCCPRSLPDHAGGQGDVPDDGGLRRLGAGNYSGACPGRDGARQTERDQIGNPIGRPRISEARLEKVRAALPMGAASAKQSRRPASAWASRPGQERAERVCGLPTGKPQRNRLGSTRASMKMARERCSRKHLVGVGIVKRPCATRLMARARSQVLLSVPVK